MEILCPNRELMKVWIKNRQKKIRTDNNEIRKTVKNVLKNLGYPKAEISILLTDDRQIQEINKKYLNRDRATDVIAFSLREGPFSDINPFLLGDVVISLETACDQAQQNGVKLEEETKRLLIHGILHLVGYDHEVSNEQALAMRLKEEELFAKKIE